MGKITRRKKDGVNIVSGKIASIAEDRLSMNIRVRDFSDAEKKWVDDEITVNSVTPLPENFVPGEPATGVGYQNGPKSILAQAAFSGENNVFNMENLCVISGEVRKVAYKPEVNEDGTPIMTRSNPPRPRKPHFDISINVNDTTGEGTKKVTHVVKVYDFANAEPDGKPSNIEKMKSTFKDFENPTDTPTFVTIATQVGQEREWENEYNGRVYVNYVCDHMGVNFIDVERLYVRERAQEAPAQAQAPQAQAPAPAPAPAAAPAAPAPAPAPAPAAPAPQAPVYGQGQPLSQPTFEEVPDEELPFE